MHPLKIPNTSIFIGFTPYHSYVSSKIIDQLDNSKVYCAFTKSWPKTQKQYNRLGLPIQQPVPGNNILLTFHLSYLLYKITTTKQAVDIYIPHPGHILSNYLFFSDIPNKRIFIYEDGLSNYIDASSHNPFIGKLKLTLARLCGLQYREYSGHLAGYDAGSYDGAYLSMPDKAVSKDRLGTLHRLSFETQAFASKHNTILFLDQDVSSRMSAEARDCCIAAMLAAYPPGKYIYHYKPHHDYSSRLSETMQPLDPKLRNLPAEILIERFRPSHVISFFSSALVNIKSGWPQVECVSLAANQIVISRNGKPSLLHELFQEMGVICL